MARTFSSLVRKQARELQAHSRNRLSLDPLYYVYALLDPRKPGSYLYTVGDKVVAFDHEPFYVGKGKGRRMYQHLEGCNRRGTHRKVQKINAIERAGYAPIVRQLSKEEPEATALA
ncbi:GIY-YIG nuclease family protein, partial [Staphylococcus aureus]